MSQYEIRNAKDEVICNCENKFDILRISRDIRTWGIDMSTIKVIKVTKSTEEFICTLDIVAKSPEKVSIKQWRRLCIKTHGEQ